MAKRGRPTKYKKQYCEDIVRFFDIPHTTSKKVTQITASGVTEFHKEVPENLPTIIGFARKIGVLSETLKEWAEKYEDFSVSYRKALELEKEFLIQNGLKGFYQPNIFQFIASNLTDMKDKSVREHTGADGGSIIHEIVFKVIDGDK